VTASIFDSDCAGSVTLNDGGYNVASGDSCGFSSAKGDVVDSSTIDLASSLADNSSSGPETLAISPESSALDVVPSSICQSMITLANGTSFALDRDERGKLRPGVSGQSNCDAGAYELQHTPGTLTQGSPTTGSVIAGTTYSAELAVRTSPSITGTVAYTTTSGTSPVTVSSTGAVSAPSTTRVGSYTVKGTDSDPVGDTGSWSFTLIVGEYPSITSAASATFTVGHAGSHQVTASGYPVPTFSLSGAPRWLSIDKTSGLVSGTPPASSERVYKFSVVASNGDGHGDRQAFTLTVDHPPSNTRQARLRLLPGSISLRNRVSARRMLARTLR